MSRREKKKPIPCPFGETIKKYRVKNHLTKRALGEALNVSSNQVSNWESNSCEPRLSSILPICRFLGIPPYEILGIPQQEDSLTENEGELIRVFRISSKELQTSVLSLLHAANGIDVFSSEKDDGQKTEENNQTPEDKDKYIFVHPEQDKNVLKEEGVIYSSDETNSTIPAKRKRGRPRKTDQKTDNVKKDNVQSAKRGRGRPRKNPIRN